MRSWRCTFQRAIGINRLTVLTSALQWSTKAWTQVDSRERPRLRGPSPKIAVAASQSLDLGNRFRKWCDEAGLPHC